MTGGPVRRSVSVPASRLERWLAGFGDRHGGTRTVDDGTLVLTGSDGAIATLHALFPFRGQSSEDFLEHVAHPPRCAVILVRRGGFAAAVVDEGHVCASEIGKRHVQGRTAAGGWSQQRFARRRQKQAHELADAAADYAARVILPASPVAYVVTGGDRPLVEQVLADPRLRPLAEVPRGPHLDVPDPRRDIVMSLPERLSTSRIDLVDP